MAILFLKRMIFRPKFGGFKAVFDENLNDNKKEKRLVCHCLKINEPCHEKTCFMQYGNITDADLRSMI